MDVTPMIGIATLDSPIGPLTLAARGDRVCLLHFGPDGPAIRRSLERWYPGQAIVKNSDPAGAGTVLAAYFAGDIHALDRITVEMNGTPFQKRVWEALRRVRAGTTVPYSAIARTIQAPSAVRAVGAANGANPVAVIVPCHRIIGSNGTLTGYGGGLVRKEWLLRHEGVRCSLFV
jgi:methylated-DNA-[protein]-cysteine S-methyltransferase